MSKVLSLEETKRIILDYIEDDRKTQAILLNGEWGCGKTFFINEKLIPSIDDKIFQVFKLSLYGISSVEKIQNMIYGKWIEKALGEKTERLGPFGDVLSKGIGIFGNGAIQFLENKIGTEGSATNAAKDILEQNIGKNKKPILIFDDIERCKIDIIELMGFLNNLSENSRYKLILIANEQEIGREDNEIATALKYGVALNSRLALDNHINKKTDFYLNGKSENEENSKVSRDDLESITNYIFEKKSIYERTREKLIGLTVPYNVPIAEAFDDILLKYVRVESVKNIVQENKEEILDLFEIEEHINLRTLIVACIAIEDIISGINQELISEKELLREEINIIVLYTVYSAMRRTNGKGEYIWPSNARYGCVNYSLYTVQDKKVYGYAFVDEYWKTQCIDSTSVHTDIKTRIDEKIDTFKRNKESSEHILLALNSLTQWYLLPDEEVKTLVKQMKKELSLKKYYAQEFKEIICTLMRINNPNFGLSPDKIQKNTNAVYDSTEGAQFVGMSITNKEVLQHRYTDWEEIPITEYVELMVEYFSDDQFGLTKEMIRMLSEEKQFAFEYRKLTLPLLNKIEHKKLFSISVDEDGISISDMNWNYEFGEYCYKNKTNFMNQGKFLSLFNYEILIERFINSTSGEINMFCDAIRKVYSFSNLIDVYFMDYDMVKSIADYIILNIEGKLNESMSRTKEIALRRLKSDINRYEKALRKVSDEFE